MSKSLEVLNYQKINELQKESEFESDSLPERVLQFGEGNFLRGFIDWMIFKMNKNGEFNSKVVALQPTPTGKVVPKLNSQDGLYTLVLRGIYQEKTVETIEIIDSIERGINPYTEWKSVLKVAESSKIEFVFSNTTEAGLQYLEEDFVQGESPLSFPGKLVAALYHRYVYFNGDVNKGWIILPCELVEDNGQVLKDICRRISEYWSLPLSFWNWIEESTVFCNTLVDRIVTGYPREEEEVFNKKLGYKDQLLTVAEPYHLFVIEGPEYIKEKLPFQKVGLNVHFDNIQSYRDLKVKLLNAPHTILTAVGVLSGIETVRDGIHNDQLRSFLEDAITLEIKETLGEKEKEKSNTYVNEVFDRFLNPFLHHRLLDISLNSFSKYKSRILPSLLDYKNIKGVYPKRLTFTLAALISFYKIDQRDGERKFGKGFNGTYEIQDKDESIERFSTFWGQYDEDVNNVTKLVKEFILSELIDEELLEEHVELGEEISKYLLLIENNGVQTALKKI